MQDVPWLQKIPEWKSNFVKTKTPLCDPPTVFLRCEISGWFWRLLAPERGLVFLRSLQWEPGTALHRPPSDKNHRHVPERWRRDPELPQPCDPGAPSHASDPFQPCWSAPGPEPRSGPTEAALRPPSTTPRVPQ